ncbi:MAG TPA: GPP34 family phosphoprotein [Actinomycetota bacterium]
MLMAEELALVAMNLPRKGPGLGMGRQLNACLAGLLLGDLVLEGVAALHPKDTIVLVPGASLDAGTLAGAASVVAGKGPKIKTVLSDMDRGLRKYAGQGTWDAVMARLPEGATGRDEVIERLRAAAASDDQIDPRTALILSMTGPAQLLELIAPRHGADRRHARNRIDHATDGSPYESISRAVRKLIAQDQAAAVM